MGAVLFAEPVTAEQAAAWGMIWEAVPDADFAATVQARATLLAEGPTTAYRLAKQALRRGLDNRIDEQLALEARASEAAGARLLYRPTRRTSIRSSRRSQSLRPSSARPPHQPSKPSKPPSPTPSTLSPHDECADITSPPPATNRNDRNLL